MSCFRPENYSNSNPSSMILVTFSTAHFWVCGFTNHADLSNLHQAGKPEPGAKRTIADLCNVPQKCQVHVCTYVPCFQNTAEATQFSGSRHFQNCLHAPSSSCLFLPTTTRLALVMRSFLPILTVPVCSMLSLRFLSGHFEIAP